MQWQPRSMIAPPPVSRPSQNHAECGPGWVSRERTHVTSPMAPSCSGLDGLEGLGRVAQVLEVAAEDPGRLDHVEHPLRLLGRPAQAASCTGPPCRPPRPARPPPHAGSWGARRSPRPCPDADRGGQIGRGLGDGPALLERRSHARRCASTRPARGRGHAGRAGCSCRSRRSGPCPASRSGGRPMRSSSRFGGRSIVVVERTRTPALGWSRRADAGPTRRAPAPSSSVRKPSSSQTSPGHRRGPGSSGGGRRPSRRTIRSSSPSSAIWPMSCTVPFVGVAPAERTVVLGERARREDVAVVAAVDDLVDVAERRCAPGATPRSPRNWICSRAPVPCSQWVRIGAPVRPWAWPPPRTPAGRAATARPRSRRP